MTETIEVAFRLGAVGAPSYLCHADIHDCVAAEYDGRVTLSNRIAAGTGTTALEAAINYLVDRLKPDAGSTEFDDLVPSRYVQRTEAGDKARAVRLAAAVRNYLATLSKDARGEFVDELLDGYCKLCFTDKLPCYCAPGYDE